MTIYDQKKLFTRFSPLNISVLLKESRKRRGGDGLGRSATDLPALQGPQVDRQSGVGEDPYRFGLAKLIGRPPLEKLLNYGRQALRRGPLIFQRVRTLQAWLLLEEFGKRCRAKGMRPRASYFPVLQSAEFHWQASFFQDSNSLGLAEVIGFPPPYKLLNYRRQVLRHCLHMMANATETSQQQDVCE